LCPLPAQEPVRLNGIYPFLESLVTLSPKNPFWLTSLSIAAYLPAVSSGYILFITFTMYPVLFAFFGGLIAIEFRK
jgi:hypothetical protein